MNGEHADAARQVATLLTDEPDERISRLLAGDCTYQGRLLEKALLDCLAALKNATVRRSRERILDELRAAAEPARKMALLAELAKLDKSPLQ